MPGPAPRKGWVFATTPGWSLACPQQLTLMVGGNLESVAVTWWLCIYCFPLIFTEEQSRRLVIRHMSTATLSRKLSSVAESWVKDPFRSNLQLQTFLKSLAAHPRLTPQAVDAACALRDNQLQKKVHSHRVYLILSP